MPYYEYKCNNCDNQKEIKLSIKDDIPQKIKCDKCNNIMNRTYSLSGIIYKCDGFYSTDKDKKK